ncbi:hypothetical protein [Paenibacillus glacialis]|uniref:Uncharacterized protein n=1 Tax=Paenibacillus glacialis TaxID=494026 RepID=A0A168HR09_9BACL|nr:hypothetical protein [Paenibacillus glacialis]OAB38441.1 hypothetical protein PGLA_20330 [Paenibacillus glacialis]
MNKWFWILLISGIAILASGGFLLYSILKERKRRKNFGSVWASSKAKKQVASPKLMIFYQKSYVQLVKIPIIKSQMLRIRKRLMSINTYDEFTLRKETMRITFLTLGIIVGSVTLLAILSQSGLAVFFGILVAIIANELFIDIFVNRVEDRILKQFAGVLEDNRHYYQELRMVDEAIYQAAQGSPHDIKMQTEKIHEILTSKEPAKELERYYAVAPNRYLKVFSGVSYLIMEYGDKVLPKGSMYLNAINKFVQEIRYDLLRRQKLRYKLGGLTLIAIVPILLSFPLMYWAQEYFPMTREFYESKMGYLIKLFIYTIAAICYVLIRKLSENDEAKYVSKGPKWQWEKKIYSWPWAKWVIDRLVPANHTRNHYRSNMLLKEVNSPLTLEWFYVHRIMMSLVSFIGVVVLCVFLHFNTLNQVFTNPTSEQTKILGYMNDKELQSAEALTASDNAIIKEVRNEREVTRDLIADKVRSNSNLDVPTEDVAFNNTVNRITEKINTINNEYFRWWELLIAIAIASIGYYFPVWLMQFQRKMRALEMQNEVDQFHVLISILSEFDRISVESVLEWMERYSIIFRPALQRCLLNFDSGAEEALRALQRDAPFESFNRITKRLLQAVEKISIRDAFDDLEMEQEYYAEQKKERLERLIRQKSSWGKMLGWTPGALLIGLYLVFPFLYMSFGQLGDLSIQMQSI